MASERELVSVTEMLDAHPTMMGEKVFSACVCVCVCKGVGKSSKEDLIEKKRGERKLSEPSSGRNLSSS